MGGIIGAIGDWLSGKQRPPADKTYRVFTREFDREVLAGDLDKAIDPLPRAEQRALDEEWAAWRDALANWSNDLEAAEREAAEAIQRAATPEQLNDTVVTLLIDHSGSMKDRNIRVALACAALADRFLPALGVKLEILAFTTRGWHGGRSRERWKYRRGRPFPGRLCDLLHIVYRTPGDAPDIDRFKPMLRPNLLRENVDGEALEWAAERLRATPEPRKILVVLSDGAPVDDSTLLENDPAILRDHLKLVIAAIQAAGDIELAGFGIGNVCGDDYPIMVYDRADERGATLLALLRRLLAGEFEPS